MSDTYNIETLIINVESGQKLTPLVAGPPARIGRVEPKPEPKYVLARSYTEARVVAEQLGFHPAEWTYLDSGDRCRGLRIRPCNLYIQHRFWHRDDWRVFLDALEPALGCKLTECPKVTT